MYLLTELDEIDREAAIRTWKPDPSISTSRRSTAAANVSYQESSDSEEDTLLEKASGEHREVSSPGAAERALGLNPELVVGLGKVMFQEACVIHANGSTQQRRPTSLRFLVVALGSLVLVAIVIGIIAAHTYTGTTFARIRGVQHITMDHIFNGTFYAKHVGLRWVPEGALRSDVYV